MPQRDLRLYLYDIIRSADLLGQFTAGKTLADYQADALVRSAVERQFEIIGEALSQAGRVDPGLADRISHFRQNVAFRNRLIHGYATVADDVVWDIVERYLPALVREITDMLDKEAEQR